MSLPLRILFRLLRLIPRATPGKARLVRSVLPSSLRAERMLIRTSDGDPLLLPNTIEPVGFALLIGGVYEPETLDFLRRHVTSDSVFIDIGANIGAFTVPIAKAAKLVISIEPSPKVLPFLQENIDLNHLSNVKIFACAASKPGDGTVPLYVPPDSHFGMASSAPQFAVAPIDIPARSLDSILAEQAIDSVSAIKVDVEGYEAHVFLGASQLLRSASPPVVIFEFCDWAEERAFPGRKGWAQQTLMEAGYALWTHAAYLRNESPLSRPVTNGSHSIIGIPRKKTATAESVYLPANL